MFASKVVRAQANKAATLTNRVGQRRSGSAQSNSSLTRNQLDSDHQPDPECLTAGNEMYGIARNFSKLPIFPAETTNQPRVPLPTGTSAIHPKLIIGKTDDPLEGDADRVAEQVTSMPGFHEVGPPPVSGAPPAKSARASIEHGNEAPGVMHEVGHPAGQPLPAAIRAFFESALDHDFGRVRIHADGRAAASARAVGALAYTAGHNVVFADGQYAPHTGAGRKLLAHELAHVRQAESGRDTATPSVRRQPATAQTSADPQPAKVKQLVQQRDPTASHELWSLIAGNALDNKPTAAGGPVTASGAVHSWMLSVELKRADLDPSGAIRGKTDPEIVSTVPARTKSGVPTKVHTIHIAINKWLGSSPEEQAAHPDLQERMNYMAAETLLHELIHARLHIGTSMAGLGLPVSSKVSAEYQPLQARAHLPAVAAEQATLRSHLISLLTAAGRFVGKPLLQGPDVSSFADDSINDLIEEKFAKQTAGKAFGLGQSISNRAVADAYGDNIERVVIKMAVNVDFAKGNALKTNDIWQHTDMANVKAAIEAFFNKLDAVSQPGTGAGAATGAAAGAASSAPRVRPP